VTRLTDRHEQRRDEPWAVTDAPSRYIEKQLRAIVGVEFAIEQIEGKAKLSQNRDDADFAGVVAGLRREGAAREHQVADAMEALRPSGR
jgi:transcriptional regulator